MNEMVLILNDAELKELAFEILWNDPGLFAFKSTKVRHEQYRQRFWDLVKKRCADFYDNCPEDHVVYVDCFGSPCARGANCKPAYYLKYYYEGNCE
ncbi:hypothetical protein VPHD479_0224 [Vibrio phage D479]